MGDQYANHAEYGSASLKVILEVGRVYLLSFLGETA